MGLVVLCGVVMFGFFLNIVIFCIVKYIYGVDKNVVFNFVIYKEFKREIIEGVEYCNGIFDIYVRVGEKIDIDEEFVKWYYILVILK